MTRILSLIFFLASIECAHGQTYFETYPKEVAAFNQFRKHHRVANDSVFIKYKIDATLALSLVAPEIGHYSVWQDKMEVAVVSLFYVEMGTEYNDFSIGYFQMKAVFAEKVEEYIKSFSLSEYYSLLKYKDLNPTAQREERVARMQSVAFQSVYLVAFISICKKMHPTWFEGCEVTTHLATAYNVGFWHSEEKIQQWKSAKHFPSSGKSAFSYAAVAKEYYHFMSTNIVR